MNALKQIDDARAFLTTGRYDLLAAEHVPFAALGADDADGALSDAIAQDEGVVCVLGVSGAGKSSLIGSVTNELGPRYVPIRIPVAAATDAFGAVGDFSQHALEQIRDAKTDVLTKRHEQSIERVLAEERTTSNTRRVGISGGLILKSPVLNAKLAANLSSTAGEELKHKRSDSEALGALQRALDVLRGKKLVPILIVEDTDHWASTADVASAFFDQVVRALSKGFALDMVTIVAVQPVHRDSDGYQAIREYVQEVEIPELPDVEDGLTVLLDARISDAGVSVGTRKVFEPPALALLAKAYSEGSASEGLCQLPGPHWSRQSATVST